MVEDPKDEDLELDMLDLAVGDVAEPGDENTASPSVSPFSPRPAERPPEIPAPQDHEQLRLATFAMVQRGVPLGDAARQYGVDPDALFLWHRTYLNFVGKDALVISGVDTPRERVEFDDDARQKFDNNWEEMMRIAELERPQLSPLRKWMLKSPLTRWMFRGEKIEPITVTGAVAVIAFTALALRAGISHRGRGDEVVEEPPAIPDLQDIAPEDLTSEEPERRQAILFKVASALDQFARLKSWRDRLPYIRNSEALKPVMEDYYRRHADRSLSNVLVDGEVSFIKRDDGMFVLMQGTLDPTRKPAAKRPQRVIFLAEIVDGDPEILFDWEVMVNYEPTPWSDFTESKSTSASPFRVRVVRGDYYNQPFMDEAKFACYAMRPLHQDEIAYGFVPRGSELAAKLDASLAKELKAHRAMILNLRFPEKAKFDNIVEIESMVSDGWLAE